MAGSLTTHVLDTTHGTGAGGMRVALRRLSPEPALLAEQALDAGGRAQLLEPGTLAAGVYELLFEVGAYFGAAAGFLDQVPVRFRVDDAGSHYHVPLIVSPFGYSTYRGG
jgi:5-hydroxyisourate hydrolase